MKPKCAVEVRFFFFFFFSVFGLFGRLDATLGEGVALARRLREARVDVVNYCTCVITRKEHSFEWNTSSDLLRE